MGFFYGRDIRDLPGDAPLVHQYYYKPNIRNFIKGELSPNFTFCLPGIEVFIEKSLPKILGRSLLKDYAKLPVYSASALWCRQFRYDFYTLCTTSQANISVCMQGSRECCPVRVRIPELFQYLSECLVRHQVWGDVTRHCNLPFGNLPGFKYTGVLHQKHFSGVALSYWPHLFFAKSFPLMSVFSARILPTDLFR